MKSNKTSNKKGHRKKARGSTAPWSKKKIFGKNGGYREVASIATPAVLGFIFVASIYKAKRSKKEKISTAPRNEPSDKVENNDTPEKFPMAAAIVLAFLCIASITTGIVYWYNAYLRPVETPAVDLAFIQEVDEAEEPLWEAPLEDYQYEHEDEYLNEEYHEDVLPRPEVEPFPEFVELWEEYGRDDIVARLLIADEEILTIQGGEVPYGWLRLDDEVDLLMGLDHNMVVYASDEGNFREILREYLEYDFFLQHPTLLLSTMYGDFDWEIFSFYVAPSDFPFAVVNHPSDEEWGEILEQFTIVSMYNTMLDVMQYDQILTIITPTDIPDLYYILQARMLRYITS